MTLALYNPHITHSPIYFPRNGAKPYLRYNHCVDVVSFRGSFLAAWNANATPREGVAGQFNYFSLSPDFRRWTPHEKLFSARFSAPSVESDNQWQPSFLNDDDARLFVMWCDFSARKSYIAVSEDGRFWKNRELAGLPDGVSGAVAFPTNHGLRTRDGVLVFPVSFPPLAAPGGVGQCRHAGALISVDRGETWEWGGIAESGREGEFLWEPMIFERDDGSWGMLIRNSGVPEPKLPPSAQRAILYAESRDRGRRWTRCEAVGLESVVSRSFAASFGPAGGSLLMAMNDWQAGIAPERSPNDRLMLSLYFAPTTDPELLMPSVLLQPPGGRAFYPNGFLEDGKLYCAYSYPDYLMGSVVHELPDFSRDFLAVRGGREGACCVPGENRLTLSRPEGTIPLFLSRDHVRQERLELFFRFRSNFRSELDFTLLTLGGKEARGGTLILRFLGDGADDGLFYRAAGSADGSERFLGTAPPGKACAVSVVFDGAGLEIGFPGKRLRVAGECLRKIAFGGLYVRPHWPRGIEPIRDEIHILHDSIRLT